MINIIVSLTFFALVKALVLGIGAREQMRGSTRPLGSGLIVSAVSSFIRTAKSPLHLLIEKHDGLHGEDRLRSGDVGVSGRDS